MCTYFSHIHAFLYSTSVMNGGEVMGEDTGRPADENGADHINTTENMPGEESEVEKDLSLVNALL